jgi:adhesin transport system membrane fusion protein
MNAPQRVPSALRMGKAVSPGNGAMPRSSAVVWLSLLALVTLGAWAYRAPLDEVTVGTGKVVPSSREQVVQSLEGGILSELLVHEGDEVVVGQTLARLDRTRIESTVGESSSRLQAALATAARLKAEVSGSPLVFPASVASDTQLVRAETALHESRLNSMRDTVAGLEETLALILRELKLTESLVAQGAASDVEVLRLKRQVSDLRTKISDTKSQYLVRAREELAKANAEIETQSSITRGRTDALSRTTVLSPVRGVVKNIEVNTVGGVIPPNGKLLEIVPVDEQLLVETRIAPRDVAFIYPGQRALVKVTAYDYAIYGGLEGRVVNISPDTIQDEVKRDQFYYRVYVRTSQDFLKNSAGRRFPIAPGMVATADIHTGEKTVWEYLVKPLNRAREALRER